MKSTLPDVVYRGSDKVFDPATTRARDSAHWFTDNEAHAASFGAVEQFVVNMSNPMEISQDDLDAAWDVVHPDGHQDDRHLLPRDFVSRFVAKAMQDGCDGLIIRRMGDRDVQADMFLPFRAENIKRVGMRRSDLEKPPTPPRR